MTYDCFPFFNELDLLEIRLNVLKDVVDRFVLVEAGETHTGKTKPFCFAANRDRFAAFADRIVYRRIEKFPAGHGAWWNENYQRNEISKVLSEIGVRDEDDILISDLDEIPNRMPSGVGPARRASRSSGRRSIPSISTTRTCGRPTCTRQRCSRIAMRRAFTMM